MSEYATALIVSAAIVAKVVSTNDEIKQLIADVMAQLDQSNDVEMPAGAPAVDPSESIADDHIVCLEDGKKLKMLKRYLRTQYGLSPEDYRRKWGLPADYPMVAPNYAKVRSEHAKKIGLGRMSKGAS